MSIEQALIAQAGPHMLKARLQAILGTEQEKGCRADLSVQTVALEPLFEPLVEYKDLYNVGGQSHGVIEPLPRNEELIRLQIWISPEQEFSWKRSELFLKQLFRTSNRLGFEIVGNGKNIIICIMCHRYDLPIVSAAFKGEFDRCELSQLKKDAFGRIPPDGWKNITFLDFFPPPPYSHLLTRPDELQSSPLESLIAAMNELPSNTMGIYQTLFQPVSAAHDWHGNVQLLLDMEYACKLFGGMQFPSRYAQQAPSGDLRQMSWDVENKAHNDKPFYAVALRVGVIGPRQSDEPLRSLATFSSLFQHGGRPLNCIPEIDYKDFLSDEQIRCMFDLGLTYRAGFLLNSWELSGLVHLPPAGIFEHRRLPFETLETLPVRNRTLSKGTHIGTCNYAGHKKRVCIPLEIRRRHTHLIGRSGTAKSTTMEHMVLDDIEQGFGVAVIDPHGDLVDRLIALLPEHCIERTIYFDPGNPEWIPIWNPLYKIPGQDVGRTADDIVHAIQNFVTVGWGDRLEHLLRNIIFSLIQLSRGTFLDVSNLLRNKSEESKRFREEILQVVDNESVRQFWLQDYEKYGKDDLGPPKNKLSKLLVSGSVSLMLSQPDSLFNFRDIMDEGMIFLANLSTIGSKSREILGCFMLSLLHLTALSRSDTPQAERKQFHIYCDEAHRFMTDALEDLIAETRKYSVSLTLAHQYISQFGSRKTDALASVGSTIIFNIDKKDAQSLSKDLRNLVRLEDLISLEIGEAIARIGTEIVRIKTPKPLKIPLKNHRERIIDISRERYYKPAVEIRKIIRRKHDPWSCPIAPLNSGNVEKDKNGRVKEFIYDEF